MSLCLIEIYMQASNNQEHSYRHTETKSKSVNYCTIGFTSKLLEELLSLKVI